MLSQLRQAPEDAAALGRTTLLALTQKDYRDTAIASGKRMSRCMSFVRKCSETMLHESWQLSRFGGVDRVK